MNAEIREILQYVCAHPEVTTREAVDVYFGQIIWSIEKAEWEKLIDQEKQEFVNALDAAKRKAPKGAFYILCIAYIYLQVGIIFNSTPFIN